MLTLFGHQFGAIATGFILLLLAIIATFITFAVRVLISEKLQKPALGTFVAIILGIVTTGLWLLFLLASGLKVFGWFIQTKVGHICLLVVLVMSGGFGFLASKLKSDSPKQVFYDKEGHMHYNSTSRAEADRRIDAKKNEQK